ncbi:enoyl-CoA hydratase-related protein [Oceanobacillus sp. FSL H7-0719]|uniref:enoyl-CoA hydratase-related protein n=1 Tax=Oceanobacillus sp. FSL H7-0719 TaxID=2954507 RepID=UPI00324BDB68
MENILYEERDHIAYVTLNRPKALNALDYQTLAELGEIIESIHLNKEIRGVIFTGAGAKAFSAGADLIERKTLGEQEVRRNVKKIRDVFNAIYQLNQPTIAAVNGYAFGGGFELMLACDFRIAEATALMGLTELNWAIIPGAGGTQRLPRLIGEAKAKELILTARKVTAVQAEAYGILNKVSEEGQIIADCELLLGEIIANAPIAIQQAKFAINNGMNTDLETGMQIEAKAYELTIPTKDRLEALQAFSEKRAPVFTGE